MPLLVPLRLTRQIDAIGDRSMIRVNNPLIVTRTSKGESAVNEKIINMGICMVGMRKNLPFVLDLKSATHQHETENFE